MDTSIDVFDAAIDVATEAPGVCTQGADAQSPGVACVLEVRGTVVDETGAPVPNLLVTVCGFDCFFGRSDAVGEFDLTPGVFLPITHYAIEVHGRPTHATVLVPLTALTAPFDGVIALARPIVAPTYTDVGGFVPNGTAGGTVTAGDVTVTIAPGSTLQPNVEDAELGDLGRELRSSSVMTSHVPPFANGLLAVYSLAPFDLQSNVPMPIALRNRTSLAPGTAVDFVVMGDEVFANPFTGGLPIVAAHGHVSTDGTSIATDPGEGVSYLTWVGIRASGG